MVKHTQTIRLLLPTNYLSYLSVFDHFVKLALKGLRTVWKRHPQITLGIKPFLILIIDLFFILGNVHFMIHEMAQLKYNQKFLTFLYNYTIKIMKTV